MRLRRYPERFSDQPLSAGWDCQKFRVCAGIMGKKEPYYVTTQRTYDTQ
jgi:hypothetical protein